MTTYYLGIGNTKNLSQNLRIVGTPTGFDGDLKIYKLPKETYRDCYILLLGTDSFYDFGTTK
ncbi:hypothetical protein [Leptospira mayottensis]|uniref:hypothetical protein n=1 Tax=Leptospira mayottensis TaxID=1137606 RepID=UPI000E358725|nr:hypothetical protein [Leptospira mayottensis]AXR67869.1 hypothetical protein DPV73_07435 [Leptospira mayottensis]